MPTDLTEDLKGFFKSAPPPRRQLFSRWHEYAVEEPIEVVEEQPVVIARQEPNIPVPVPEPVAYVPVANQNKRRVYNNETRNIRRMAVLQCMQSGMTNRIEIGKKLGLPAGTVFHDLMYWRRQQK